MTYKEIYAAWLKDESFDEAFRLELEGLSDETEIEDRFYKDLSFGTAGMRGIIGAGRNRINKYIVRKATQGYANYLLSKDPDATCVIAYDNRRMSIEFSEETAAVFAANGIKTYLFDSLRTTPELSFAIRELETTGGVVITASHNPPEYNGYKVYGPDGAQLIPVEADKVADAVNAVTDFSEVKYMDFDQAIASGKIVMIGQKIDDLFLHAVKKQIVNKEAYQTPMTIAYSPLHGTGGMIIEKLMGELGVDDIRFVKEQMVVDTEFTTCKQPNPENLEAFEVSMAFGETVDAKLLIATDPDADRVGVVVRDRDGVYVPLNGNQIGALLTNYVLSTKKNLPENGIIVKTVVTSDLGPKIAKDFGVDFVETLTGFKFIGEKIRGYEEDGTKNFILGFEESYGYLIGTHARDKDAVVATMLVVEMAKYFEAKGKNLLEVLDELYQKYGYHLDHMVSKTLAGKAGMEQITEIMAGFRTGAKAYFGDLNLVKFDDFEKREATDLNTGAVTQLEQPNSDVLKYYLEDGSWFAVRPSGTEPKIKFYCSVQGETKEKAETLIEKLEKTILAFVDHIIE
ncbi:MULTISPECIES: phospho-sugar mutase [unclassified Fusibacter]|uniref:phospho-sugar mutase n=1 Tax=unclassified Fusibacter TaxID=2624464 RepID=UPI00101236F3|nr:MULTISPECIES: phospho-sugar mutase [unclassified Fusibacter]MCK8059849.1 phospho-sugar mutase [Fusibacter sp. A2]NPE21651.1 phospho-sugar mutase [Fusibacter sp. A1]RXV62055.1 phospho-sugar mutase [Fusibacter sp. A1]